MADEIEVTVVVPEAPVAEVIEAIEEAQIAPVETVTPTLVELALRLGACEATIVEMREKVAVATIVSDQAERTSEVAVTVALENAVAVEETEDEIEDELEESEIPAIEEIPESIDVNEAMPEIVERGKRKSRFI